MVKFHFHKWPGHLLPGKPGKKGMVRCCHVYSTTSREELLVWAKEHRIAPGWIQERRWQMPHFDLWGSNLKHCGPGVTDRECAADLKRWREKNG